MTPADFEWAVEQIELAYLHGKIGKLTYLRRMSALGFNDIAERRKELAELDKRRVG